MRWKTLFGGFGALLGVTPFLILPTVAWAQAGGESPAPKAAVSVASSPEVRAINDAYDRDRLQLERKRLEDLAQLAARQAPAAAASTYEVLFRLAISNNLFVEAGPTAEAVANAGSSSTTTFALANLVKLIAECDRGEYEKSLKSLQGIVDGVEANLKAGKGTGILTSEKIELCDLYFQRLVHSDQIAVARKAFQILKDHVKEPAIADFVASRLRRLELVGKPAPAIQGTDLDGKPFNLADAKGKVVLVVFWASWCLPCASEIESLKQVVSAYRSRGLQVVGINLDDLPDDGQTLDNVLPNIRHFLLDYNVTWPTLINGGGDKNFAEAYGVTAIPSNTLVGRDGTVIQIDLVSKNFESVIDRATAR